jgi:aminopeptidase N
MSDSLLTETEAISRGQNVATNLTYNMFFDLQKGNSYSGLVLAEFTALGGNQDQIFMDFSGKVLDTMTINGTDVTLDETNFVNGKIWLPNANIKVGETNQVLLKFSNNYYNDGNGLHSFTDVDDSQYMYVQSEPFWGNRVCPMFDQPDLKAKFTLFTSTPEEWKVITSEFCNTTTKVADFMAAGDSETPFHAMIKKHYAGKLDTAFLLKEFNQTRFLSTYLHNFITGPFHEIVLPEAERYENIPMSIFCRAS